MTSKLTEKHLREVLVRSGYRSDQKFHGKKPFVGFIDSPNGDVIGGRYFPDYNALLVYRSWDKEVTKALVLHELTHAEMQSETRRYNGNHLQEYYRRLERRYRENGISLRAARIVEGKYTPKHWLW